MSFSGTPPDLFEWANRLADPPAPPAENPPKNIRARRAPKKNRQLLIPYALRDGELVHVAEVESGHHSDCLCAGCGSGLVARKGTQVVHHFAHPSDAVCKGETALHNVAKHIAARKLEKCIREGSAMRIKWECGNCHDYHLGDLVKTAATVEVEKALGPTRPDILLSDQAGAPRVAVEIVVTHAPEKSTVEFYRENKITLVTVNVKTTDDLEELRNSDSLPVARVDACLRKKCTKCRKPLWERNMVIRASSCHKCMGPMPVAMIEIEDTLGIDEVRPSDREILVSAGVALYRGRDGLLNCCPDCRYPVYPKSLRYHERRRVQRTLPAGLYCDSCETVSYNRGPAVGGRLSKGCRHETQVTY